MESKTHPPTPRSTPPEDDRRPQHSLHPSPMAAPQALSRAFEAYRRSQRKRPYLTRFYSSLGIYFGISGEEYDPFRTLRALAIGAGSSVPSFK
jgi:hypothetical protein